MIKTSFDDQVQPFCISRILQNQKHATNNKQTNPKFVVEFLKYKIYHVGGSFVAWSSCESSLGFFFFHDWVVWFGRVPIEAISSFFQFYKYIYYLFIYLFIFKVRIAMVYFNYLLVRQLFSPNLNYYFLVFNFLS
jgi:hypothetical protein